MTKNYEEFLKYLTENKEAYAKIEAVFKEENEEKLYALALQIADDAGLPLTREDIKGEGELCERELRDVAGGAYAKPCFCIVGGGGVESDISKACACVFGGGGSYKDGGARCACVAYGDGGAKELF